jgi:hypothetical protein
MHASRNGSLFFDPAKKRGSSSFRLCRRFAVLLGRLARLLESAGGVFVRLARKLMGSEAALTMGGCGCGVGMRGKVVVFGGSVVWALGH